MEKAGTIKNDSLPDIYSNIGNGNLNTKRIKAYQDLKELYNLEEGTIRDIFCKGADWYKEILEKKHKWSITPTLKGIGA